MNRTLALCLIAFTSLALLAARSAQAAAPSVKPGLWETRVTSDKDEPEDGHDCITAEEAANMDFTKDIGKQCSVQNLKQSAVGMSADYLCASPSQKGRGHFELAVDNRTKFAGRYVYDGQLIIAGKSTPLKLDLKMEGRWVAADCGEYADE